VPAIGTLLTSTDRFCPAELSAAKRSQHPLQRFAISPLRGQVAKPCFRLLDGTPPRMDLPPVADRRDAARNGLASSDSLWPATPKGPGRQPVVGSMACWRSRRLQAASHEGDPGKAPPEQHRARQPHLGRLSTTLRPTIADYCPPWPNLSARKCGSPGGNRLHFYLGYVFLTK
jgi:hypothetical protein